MGCEVWLVIHMHEVYKGPSGLTSLRLHTEVDLGVLFLCS